MIQSNDLKARYDALLQDEPKMRIRNAAQQLGVSEMELVAAQCGDIEAILLEGTPQTIFKELQTLGEVMLLTRNEWCVHERHGRYESVKVGNGPVGLVLGADIDLRVFFSSWKYTWAVTQNGRKSVQFFDKAGMALHKVYCTDKSDMAAYDALIEKFRAVAQEPAPVDNTPAEPKTYASEVPESLRKDWLAMTDTHDFAGLLKKWNLPRLQVLENAGQDLAQRVDNEAIEVMLNKAAQTDLAIMCFVGNKGIIQIHSGPIKKLMRTGPWFNILDPKFNLHLNTTAIHSTWIVNKPTEDGWVTSLEGFTQDGEQIVQFFGARKPGVPEIRQWRELLESLCKQPLAA
ncbi:hemin-degrading factor [Advenella sp. S44]|nr:ChuX/HutX family heme-like substrate-binding protein [Advenella sp. S44]PJX22418.1 hemin-degrading factor [Advenella sp. S44]